MNNKNSVYIATSLDGFIAGKNGELDWLNSFENPEQIDMGYGAFMETVDVLVMGRTSFETVLGFDVDWPYTKPFFVLSNTMNEIPASHEDKAFLVKGKTMTEVVASIHQKGFQRLYIDGGRTIQSFLQEDLIDEMIITTIPILLGGGIPLFGDLPNRLGFKCVKSEVFLGSVVQNWFVRVRENSK